MRKFGILLIIFIFSCGSESSGWDSDDGKTFEISFLKECNTVLKQDQYCTCVLEEIKSKYPKGPFSKINIDMTSFANSCNYLKH